MALDCIDLDRDFKGGHGLSKDLSLSTEKPGLMSTLKMSSSISDTSISNTALV